MHQLIKFTPLLLGAVSLSACSALGFGQSAYNSSSPMSGNYTQTASNTHSNTMSDYDNNSGWYAGGANNAAANPYAGGQVVLEPQPTEIYPQGQVKTAHNGYHDQYGNPVPAPSPQTGTYRGPYTGPTNGTQRRPSLRGSYGPSYYGNIGGIMYDVDDDIFGIVGRLGVQKDWYGAEVEGSFGVNDDDIGGGIDAEVDHSLAAFAVGRLPVGKRFNALARVGYHTTQIGVSDNIGSASDDFDGIAYGAGLEYDFDNVNGVRFDYTRYDLNDGAGTADSLAATYLRRF